MIVEPGTVVHTEEDVPVPAGQIVPLAGIPPHARRQCIQITEGDETTLVRIRELGGAAGSGIILAFLDIKHFGGADGALTRLEAENVAGPDSAVAVQFEID